MIECNQFWYLDVYHKQKIKDFKSTNLCGDKFCSNCKKVKQASRMGKFIPLIEPYREQLYQMVLTVPNVQGNALDGMIKEMFESYYRLNRIIKGEKKIRGIDFVKYGYQGSIRSLEITYREDSYHPHIHALIALKGKIGVKNNENVFSQDFLGRRSKRLFSDLEILIQKIWKLLITGVKVTKFNIDNLDIGFSCMMDKSKDDDFQEIFKYMCKGEAEDHSIMTYENFLVLYKVLFKVRQIQGYGVFYNIDDDTEDFKKQVDEVYDKFIDNLKQKESPVGTLERPSELIKNFDDFIIITRKRVFKYLKECLLND